MDDLRMAVKDFTYFQTIKNGLISLIEGFGITFKHFRAATQKRKPLGIENPNYFVQDTGIVTTEYPYESIPVPDNGRYRLYNEIDDCIVCDLCAKICPVNCIDIVPIKSPDEIGKTSDGTTKRIYAATFDIDMAKCCYCGLCTTVCPTECLTMTKTYDYSEFDIRNMNYHFTNLSPQEAEGKKKVYEEFQSQKKEKTTVSAEPKVETGEKKPAFKPVIKTAPKQETDNATSEESPKPTFKPVIKVAPKAETTEGNTEEIPKEIPKPKPVFKPVIKPPKKDDTNS